MKETKVLELVEDQVYCGMAIDIVRMLIDWSHGESGECYEYNDHEDEYHLVEAVNYLDDARNVIFGVVNDEKKPLETTLIIYDVHDGLVRTVDYDGEHNNENL